MRRWPWKPILIIVSLITVAVIVYLVAIDKPKPFIIGYYRGTYCSISSELEGILNFLSTTPDPNFREGQIDNNQCLVEIGELYSNEDTCPAKLSSFFEGDRVLTFCQKAIFVDVPAH